MKKSYLALFIAAILFGAASVGVAETYNFGNTDSTLLFQRIFNPTSGHDHDGSNSKLVANLAASVTVGTAVGRPLLHGTTVVITAGATPALTVPAGVNFIATDTITTDNQDQTITFSSGGTLGQVVTLIFTTDTGGSADEVITLHTTLTNTTGTLTLANLTAGVYTVTLKSDGTVWQEISRTGAQT